MHLDEFKNWPEVCETRSYCPHISISDLLPDQKRLLWQHLNKSFPEKAKSISQLMDDPIVLDLMEKFGAKLLLEEKYIPSQLRWLIRK